MISTPRARLPAPSPRPRLSPGREGGLSGRGPGSAASPRLRSPPLAVWGKRTNPSPAWYGVRRGKIAWPQSRLACHFWLFSLSILNFVAIDCLFLSHPIVASRTVALHVVSHHHLGHFPHRDRWINVRYVLFPALFAAIHIFGLAEIRSQHVQMPYLN